MSEGSGVLMFGSSAMFEIYRNQDISTIESFKECIDNSADWDSGHIDIWLRRLDKGDRYGAHRYTIIDDGAGIPEKIPDKWGGMQPGIPYVMSGGGRAPTIKRLPNGKFGQGLTASIISLTSKARIYSRSEGESEFRHCYYDYDSLQEQKYPELPKQNTSDPSLFLAEFKATPYERGTILFLEEVDRSEYTDISRLENALVSDIARTYRWHIARGLKITVNGRLVKPSDPLFGMPESQQVGYFGDIMTMEETIVIPLDGKANNLPECKMENGRHAEILVKVGLIDAVEFRNTIEAKRSSQTDNLTMDKEEDNARRRWKINYDNQGFSVLRNNREISYGNYFGILQPAGPYNYIRAQIEFTHHADEILGVKNNKSRLNPIQPFKDILKTKVSPLYKRLRGKHLDALGTSEAIQDKIVTPAAEDIAAKAIGFLPERESNEDTERAAAVLLEELKKNALNELEKQGNLTKDQREVRKQAITNRFQDEKNVHIDFCILGSGDFYEVLSEGKMCIVKINTQHPYYKKVYSLARTQAKTKELVDVQLMALAYTEHLTSIDEGWEIFWNKVRRECSAVLSAMADYVRAN